MQLNVFNVILTLILLTWTKWLAPTSAIKWRMGFNSAFKGLNMFKMSEFEEKLKIYSPLEQAIKAQMGEDV
jgi:ABC-type uncharacterized transport system fused permease/ATPase subunit